MFLNKIPTGVEPNKNIANHLWREKLAMTKRADLSKEILKITYQLRDYFFHFCGQIKANAIGCLR